MTQPDIVEVTESDLLSDGWEERPTAGFTAALGRLWQRGHGESRQVGFIAPKAGGNNHMNSVHGGALMTLGDIALGICLVDALGMPRCATQHLNIQFMSPGRLGEFIYCEPELVRCGKSVAVMRGLIKSGERLIASCEGSWKLFPADKFRKID